MSYAGIEGGGTTFECVVGTGPDDIKASATIPTTGGDETMAAVAAFYADHAVDAAGIGMFGPIDLDPASPTCGRVTTTPKPGWAGFDVLGRLGDDLGVPVAIDTDVNAAAVGEGRWGAGAGLHSFLYVTVGTGIGGGGLIEGAPIHGRTHPEMGHQRIPRHTDDDYAGICPYHGDCWEGLASGPAIEARWGKPASDLGADLAAARDLEAFYLGTGLANLTLILSPQRIIVGGGVMGMPGLLDATRAALIDTLAGYVRVDPDDYLVAPGLGTRSGVLGAVAMAEDLIAR